MALNDYTSFVEKRLEENLKLAKEGMEKGTGCKVERDSAEKWATILMALRMHPGAIPSPPAKRKRELQLDEHDHGVE
jgi:hypothetical protein